MKQDNENQNKKQEKISLLNMGSISKRSVDKTKLTGEIMEICNPEQLRAEMRAALVEQKRTGMSKLQAAFSTPLIGKVLFYKKKGEIKAICICALEEWELPVSAARMSEKRAFDKKNKARVMREEDLTENVDDKKQVVTEDEKKIEITDEAVADRGKDEKEAEKKTYEKKWCYVCRKLYIAPSYEAYREQLEKKFKTLIADAMQMNDVPAYVWACKKSENTDEKQCRQEEADSKKENGIETADGTQADEYEIVMANQIKDGSAYSSAWTYGGSIGMCLGIAFGMLMDPDNFYIWMMMGFAIGTVLMGGTTTIVMSRKR